MKRNKKLLISEYHGNKKESKTVVEGGAKMEARDFKKHLDEIAGILEWFDAQDELDVEMAFEKVKRAAVLIKESKKRLTEAENVFNEIKADIEE